MEEGTGKGIWRFCYVPSQNGTGPSERVEYLTREEYSELKSRLKLDYAPNLFGGAITKGEEKHTQYVIHGGILEFIENRREGDAECLILGHEQKEGLENMIFEMKLPKPTKQIPKPGGPLYCFSFD